MIRYPHCFLLLLISVFLSGCGRIDFTAATSEKQISDTGFYFDTVVTITLNGTDDDAVLKSCFSLMADYEKKLSRTLEGSDVWNINHSSGAPTEVSEDTERLIKKALDFAALSDGAFDPTIASVVSLWNFRDNDSCSLPDRKAVEEALTHVDYRNVNLHNNTVTLKDPETSIDLGGIAKGYIADRLKEYLESEGIESGTINLGGNLLAIGKKNDEKMWKFGIQKPFGESSELAATVSVDDMSVVTSGTYERYFKKDGVIYHHILDPENGCPVQNGLQSVTILSRSSADGDALSTACFVLGLERGMELIESIEDTEALFITEDGKLHRTSGFPEE